MCVLHYETVPAVVRWVVSHDVQSTIMTWCLWCLMCCSGLQSQSPLSLLFRGTAWGLCLSPPVSLMPPFSTGTASASSPRNKTARCTAAWRPQPRPRCSNTPSRSGRNLQRKAEDSGWYLVTLLFYPLVCLSAGYLPKTHEWISIKFGQISLWPENDWFDLSLTREESCSLFTLHLWSLLGIQLINLTSLLQ